ncbi:MAG: aspartate/methionine/tyrosine aminotransferase [Bradymonadia bacterium]|jgi:aspartate/methionine/tyrosine aminotransferase
MNTPTLSPIAAELNARIEALNPAIAASLSAKGSAAFFPSRGILAQAGQARGKGINATIGVALEDDGEPLALDCVGKHFNLPMRDALLYAPSYGKPALRDRWQTMIYAKNPSLGDAQISRPVVTCALTHALSIAGQLFLDPGDRLICADLFWGNYKLIFSAAHGATLDLFPTFLDGRFNTAGLRSQLLSGEPGKRVVMLNFPNNPTGYTPTELERADLIDAFLAAAEAGNDVTVLIDDAYFGLVYEDGVMRESIFSALATLHPRLLAVKIDGATKEDYVWGLRVGFLTYGVQGGTPALYSALEDKTAGAIRGNISNAPHVSQSILLAAYGDPEYEAQKVNKFNLLKARYAAVRAVLNAHPEYAESFTALPFNSGYFMCVRPTQAEAEAVRQRLLAAYDTGVIATAGLVRLAFSSTPTGDLERLFANLYAACKDVASGKI